MTERKIALYDIDKTSYPGFLFYDLVRYLFESGIFPESNFSAIEKNIQSYSKGEITYEEMAQNALEYGSKGLKGKRVKDAVNNTRKFFQTEGSKFLPFVRESINLLNPTHDTYFVTAQPQFVAEEVTRINQATGYFSTMLEVKDGVFTGNVVSSLVRKENKGNILKQLLITHPKEESFAFGDSDNDIEMLEGVEYPICVNPNGELTRIATERGWLIKKPEEIVVFIRGVMQPNAKT